MPQTTSKGANFKRAFVDEGSCAQVRVLLRGSCKGFYKGATNVSGFGFKGPCTQIVYTLAPKYLHGDCFKGKIYTIWVHGPFAHEPSTSTVR